MSAMISRSKPSNKFLQFQEIWCSKTSNLEDVTLDDEMKTMVANLRDPSLRVL